MFDESTLSNTQLLKDSQTLAATLQDGITSQHTARETDNGFTLINPANGKLLGQLTEFGCESVDSVVREAQHTFERGLWSKMPLADRKKRLLKWADLVEKNAYTLALRDTLEMGMPISFSLNMNVTGAINCIRWYAESIDKIYSEVAPSNYDNLTLITREPVGVVAAITAWNVPLLVAATKVAPALMLGNSVILKPAEQSSLSAIKLEALAREADIPPGVFSVATGRGEQTGQLLVKHPEVNCITFTGSSETGKQIFKYVSESTLKKVCLECGGKSPTILFPDCDDLEKATEAATRAMFFNQGQTCIASSRLLVHESIYDDVLPLVIKHAKTFQPSDPLTLECNFGPLVDSTQYNNVLSFIEKGRTEKADLVLGGKPVLTDSGGYFIEPTIYTQVKNSMDIAQTEIFGPVLSIITFKDDDEAIKIANDTQYGLGASLWTSELKRAHKVSRAIRAGMVRVNAEGTGGFVAPFGGYKASGIGRDKSLHALNEYSELKSTLFDFN